MLKEVWKMKDKVYYDTKNMSYKEFFAYINDKTKNFNIKVAER